MLQGYVHSCRLDLKPSDCLEGLHVIHSGVSVLSGCDIGVTKQVGLSAMQPIGPLLSQLITGSTSTDINRHLNHSADQLCV